MVGCRQGKALEIEESNVIRPFPIEYATEE